MSPKWLVFDVRLAKEGVNSGISRFIVEITRALAKEISSRQNLASASSVPKLLLVSKFEPPRWIIELVHQFPESVSFWSGGKGALSSWLDKPVYYWPTLTFKNIKAFFGEDFLWIAPANFDRPLSGFIGNRTNKKVVQIVHDTIPFEQRKSVGLIFGFQYRSRIKRAVNRLPLIFTVSKHSEENLRKIGLVNAKIAVLGEGVEPLFGKLSRPRDDDELLSLRKELFSRIGLNLSQFKKDSENFFSRKWILGVGRHQSYKCWDVAEHSIVSCRNKIQQGVLFLRLGCDAGGMEYYKSRGALMAKNACYLPDQSTLVLSNNVGDEELASFYRVSDLLIHPSMAEGFGLPPLEAALSGTPVLFRKGTAIDGHFPPQVLPDFYWHGVDGINEGEWALGILHMMERTPRSSSFYKEMSLAPSPREFIGKLMQKRCFEWDISANVLLDAICGISTH